MMSITTSRPIAAIRVGPMAPTEWSMALSRNACRSKTSPGNEDAQDLPPSVGHQAVAACHPASENKCRARRFALNHDVGASAEAFFAQTQRLEQADILVRERREL
jgi:hypothetical protein